MKLVMWASFPTNSGRGAMPGKSSSLSGWSMRGTEAMVGGAGAGLVMGGVCLGWEAMRLVQERIRAKQGAPSRMITVTQFLPPEFLISKGKGEKPCGLVKGLFGYW